MPDLILKVTFITQESQVNANTSKGMAMLQFSCNMEGYLYHEFTPEEHSAKQILCKFFFRYLREPVCSVFISEIRKPATPS
jgi:hypothetical protein